MPLSGDLPWINIRLIGKNIQKRFPLRANESWLKKTQSDFYLRLFISKKTTRINAQITLQKKRGSDKAALQKCRSF